MVGWKMWKSTTPFWIFFGYAVKMDHHHDCVNINYRCWWKRICSKDCCSLLRIFFFKSFWLKIANEYWHLLLIGQMLIPCYRTPFRMEKKIIKKTTSNSENLVFNVLKFSWRHWVLVLKLRNAICSSNLSN